MTAIGKTRYSRGKELSKERHEIKKNEKSRLTEQNAKRLKELEDEAYRIAGKYGLDADDGGGGNTMKYDEKTLEKASRRYMSKWDEIEDIQQEIDRKAKEYADSKMIEKYGETALSDIKHYHSVKSGIAFVGIEMALIGTLVLGVKGDFS